MGLLKLYVITKLIISSIMWLVKQGGRNITVELFVLVSLQLLVYASEEFILLSSLKAQF